MARPTMVCASLAGCVLIWSCGSEADSGEQSLHLRASLDITEARAAGRNVVSLLYSDSVSELHLQEFETTGKFPSDLQLELDEAPPKGALHRAGHLKEPAIAVGYLTAVGKQHFESMRYPSTWVHSKIGRDPWEITDQWCANFECYTEIRECQRPDDPPEQCELHTYGDAALKGDRPWDMFAGVSKNYVVLYASEPLEAGSVTAALFAAPDGLSAGYHVLSMEGLWDSEVVEANQCWNDAQDQAMAAINDKDGTEYAAWQVLEPCEDEHSWLEARSALCDLPLEEREAVRNRLEAATWRGLHDRGCLLSRRRLKLVETDEPLQVQLTQDTGANSVVLY